MLGRVVRAVGNRIPARLLRWAGRRLLGGRRREAFRERIAARLATGEVVVQRGRLRGRRLRVDGSNMGYALGISEPAVQEALAEHLRAGAVAYDVGANIGFLTLVMADLVGGSGHVYAFEPVRENVAALRHNLTENGVENVTVLEIALGAAQGVGDIEFEPGAESFLRASLDHRGDPDAVRARVTVETGDALVASGRCPAPDLVKIDVERTEAEVLAGMRRILDEHHPVVICEVHEADRDAPLWKAVRERLHASGYAVSELGADPAGMPHVLALPAPRPETPAPVGTDRTAASGESERPPPSPDISA